MYDLFVITLNNFIYDDPNFTSFDESIYISSWAEIQVVILNNNNNDETHNFIIIFYYKIIAASQDFICHIPKSVWWFI